MYKLATIGIMAGALAGCFQNQEADIKAHLENEQAILEWGFRVESIRERNGTFYVNLELPAAYYLSPELAENALYSMCPTEAIHEFWKEGYSEFYLIGLGETKDRLAKAKCTRGFDISDYATGIE